MPLTSFGPNTTTGSPSETSEPAAADVGRGPAEGATAAPVSLYPGSMPRFVHVAPPSLDV